MSASLHGRLDLGIDQLAASHHQFATQLRGWGEKAILDFAAETIPDLATAVGPKTERQGKAAVTADILKIVRPVIEGPVDSTSVSRLVSRRRDDGRVKRRSKNKFRVRLSDYLRYRDEKHGMVGYSAGGYQEAARRLGVVLPSWMTDNPAPGSFAIDRKPDGILITVKNEVPWAMFLPDAMSRSGVALQSKAGRLYDLSVEAFEQAARQSGL